MTRYRPSLAHRTSSKAVTSGISGQSIRTLKEQLLWDRYFAIIDELRLTL